MTDITKDDEFILAAIRPEAEPQAVQIDAYIGDLYLGQRTYYGCSSIKDAKQLATRYIQQHGSLN